MVGGSVKTSCNRGTENGIKTCGVKIVDVCGSALSHNQRCVLGIGLLPNVSFKCILLIFCSSLNTYLGLIVDRMYAGAAGGGSYSSHVSLAHEYHSVGDVGWLVGRDVLPPAFLPCLEVKPSPVPFGRGYRPTLEVGGCSCLCI